MAKSYLHIPAEGQLDPTCCWAACLKWWLRAAKSVNKKQRTIIDKYETMTNSDGTMDNPTIEWLIIDNDMYPEVFSQASRFTADVVKQRLSYGPLYVAYTETSTQRRHVNVIHGIKESGSGAIVKVMEPQARQNPDWTYKGEHQLKNISEFNRFGTVYIGYK